MGEMEALRNIVREMVRTPEGAMVLAEMPEDERAAFLAELGFDTVPSTEPGN